MQDFFFISNMIFIFSFVGCILETSYTLFITKHLKIRKTTRFLPFCPVYGIGATAMYFTLYPFDFSPLAVIFLGIAVGSTVEYLYGWAVLKIFHVRVWDYIDKKHSFNRLITPFFSAIWGILAPIFIYLIVPVIVPLIRMFDDNISLFIFLIMLMDFIFSLDMLTKIKKGKSPEYFQCPVLKSAK